MFYNYFLINQKPIGNHGNNDNNTATAACYRPHFTEGGCDPLQARNQIGFSCFDGLHRQSIF